MGGLSFAFPDWSANIEEWNIPFGDFRQLLNMSIDKSDRFAQNLAGLLAGRGMTQVDLANALQVTQSAVSRYVQGRVPRPLILLRMARLFNINTEELLTGSSVGGERLTEGEHQKSLPAFERCSIKVDDKARKMGRLTVSPKYWARRSSAFPKRITLLRPPHGESLALLRAFQKDRDEQSVLFACLPNKLRNDDFVGSLAIASYSALLRAACELVFGEDPENL
jgi:predicted transcriptional regulator